MKILHISDLHIHMNEKKNERVVQALNYIYKHYPDHIIVVTGDIVDSGTKEQYERAYQLLFPFCGRILVCPGNHSEGIKGNFYNKVCAKMFDDFLSLPLKQNGTYYGYNSPVVSNIKDFRFIGLDSNIESNSAFRFAQGIIGNKQLKLLKPLLDTAQIKVLYFHHHPFMYTDPTMRLKDSKKLEKVITGQVDVLLFGHKHVPQTWQGKWDIPWICAADALGDADTCMEISNETELLTVKEVPIR